MRTARVLRYVVLIALLLTTVSTAFGQEGGEQVVIPPGQPIKIALVTDLTGPIAPMGVDIQRSGEMAVAEVNENGGVEGWQVELVVLDDRCSGDEGTTVANRVVSDPQIVAVAGHACSGATIAASDVYEQARLPMVSPSATNATLTSRGYDIVNRVAFSDGAQGVVDANYLYKILGIRTLAVMHDNDAYGLGLGEVVRDEFERLGGTVVAFAGINVDDQDYRPILTPIATKSPEAIFFGGYQEQAVLLVTQMQDVGMGDVVFFSDDGTQAQAFIDGAGEAAEGAYASFAETPPGNVEANEAFDARYKEAYGVSPDEQGPFHAHSYDSLMIIMNAIKAVATKDDAGNLVIDREELITAVRNTKDYEGLTGLLSCDENGECGAGRIVVFQVQDGEWVQVDVPEDLLTMDAQ